MASKSSPPVPSMLVRTAVAHRVTLEDTDDGRAPNSLILNSHGEENYVPTRITTLDGAGRRKVVLC